MKQITGLIIPGRAIENLYSAQSQYDNGSIKATIPSTSNDVFWLKIKDIMTFNKSFNDQEFIITKARTRYYITPVTKNNNDDYTY